MRMLRLLGLLAILSQQLAPQLAEAQAAPAKPAPAPTTEGAAQAPTQAPAPVAPAAPPGAFPQTAEPAPPANAAPPPPVGPYPPSGYGYGYGYPPAPVDPARAKTLGELQGLDLRIQELRRQQKRYSLGGPIAMTSAGFAVSIGFGVGALLSWAIAEDIQHHDCGDYNSSYYYADRCDINNDGDVDYHDEHDARRLARTFGAVSAIGGGVGILGTVWLVKRLAKRQQFEPELDQLSRRRGELLQQLRYGAGYSNNGLQLTLSGRF